jgi:hypothetical protein
MRKERGRLVRNFFLSFRKKSNKDHALERKTLYLMGRL